MLVASAGKRGFAWGVFVLVFFETTGLAAQKPNNTLGEEPFESPRQLADQEAKKSFRELHFFSDGRGMTLSPGLVGYIRSTQGLTKNIFKNRAGLVVNSSRIEGLFEVRYKKMNIGVLGCVACHGGKAAGRYIVGLGNKNIDANQMGKDTHRVAKWWKNFKPRALKSKAYQEAENYSIQFAEYLSRKELGNLTQGLVPVSFIRGWFYRVTEQKIPQLSLGQVKVPALWGYGEKRKVGQFCDGFGDGERTGWAVAVELAAGQDVETARKYMWKVDHAEELFNDFLPPPYPFAIDRSLAAQGKTIFAQSCSRCHGTYERDRWGLPIYQAPKFIRWERVQTDSDRIDGNTEAFFQLVQGNPFNDYLKPNWNRKGYFAPRLEGIWSRFPYLHNASVPTLMDLLEPADKRPTVFSLRNAGEESRFDQKRVGLKVVVSNQKIVKAQNGERSVYFTKRIGHSNQGHEFLSSGSLQEKKALVEYLKTL